ncbi:hypothetical protein DOTSEDRAFT_35950 [Dothistroma septosporum NZE10]|uniref:Uncharacterized protein n=1 Tax=Dothistroma septosporum (strain NZE10 / CBS 128990) TaxID=675120 RepID=N1PL06_DOTSN|nr:hypothetical protein DOTSEDRAFT_35950 [Dothistroma septosporum NZE10]
MPPLGNQDYATCTDTELHDFIRERTKKALPPRLATGRETLIAKLLDLDKQWTFRFLDLSAELRNEIYLHLLTLRSPSTKPQYCYPNILAACRQTNNEARNMIYGKNEVAITIDTLSYAEGRITTRDAYGVVYPGPSCLDGPTYPAEINLASANAMFDHHIWQKLGSLRVCAFIDTYIIDDSKIDTICFNGFNHLMYALADAVAGNTSLQKVEIELQFCSDDDKPFPGAIPRFESPEDLAKVLYPLARLAKGASVQQRDIIFKASSRADRRSFPDKIELLLKQQIMTGTPGPSAPIATIVSLIARGEEINALLGQSDKFWPRLEVLVMSRIWLVCELEEREELLDASSDARLCKRIAALQVCLEEAEGDLLGLGREARAQMV